MIYTHLAEQYLCTVGVLSSKVSRPKALNCGSIWRNLNENTTQPLGKTPLDRLNAVKCIQCACEWWLCHGQWLVDCYHLSFTAESEAPHSVLKILVIAQDYLTKVLCPCKASLT